MHYLFKSLYSYLQLIFKLSYKLLNSFGSDLVRLITTGLNFSSFWRFLWAHDDRHLQAGFRPERIEHEVLHPHFQLVGDLWLWWSLPCRDCSNWVQLGGILCEQCDHIRTRVQRKKVYNNTHIDIKLPGVAAACLASTNWQQATKLTI